jgi:hypothetical protein
VLTLTKRVYRAARNAMETLGATPDRLEREDLAQLSIGVDNAIGDLAPAPQRGYELIEVQVTAIAARFSQIQISSPFGFWIDRLQQLVVNPPNLIACLVPAPSLAGSTAVVTVLRPWQGEPIAAADLSLTGGDAAVAPAPATTWAGAVNNQLLLAQRRIWIAPGATLVIGQDTANVAVRALVGIQVSREGA